MSIVGILIIKIGIQEMFDNRPFQFEKYKTEEEFKKAAEIKFPIGSNLEAGIKILELSGADCHIYNPSDSEKRYVIVGSCKYKVVSFTKVNFLNFLYYRIYLCADINHKIVEVDSDRFHDMFWP